MARVLHLQQQLKTWCTDLHPAVCAPAFKWLGPLLRGQLGRRLVRWERARWDLVHRDLTDQRNRELVAQALWATPGGAAVAGAWLQRVDALERHQVVTLTRMTKAAQTELELADRRAARAVAGRRAELESEAQRRVRPAVAALQAASERVRQEGRALGYAPG